MFSTLSVRLNCASASSLTFCSLCLFRNLSSVNDKTRQQMRETPGLVDSLVSYINTSLEDGKTEDKVR